MSNFAQAADFLNHLCDGEHGQKKALAYFWFLNHLCDGELRRSLIERDGGFLNHLCDGEPL